MLRKASFRTNAVGTGTMAAGFAVGRETGLHSEHGTDKWELTAKRQGVVPGQKVTERRR